MEKDEALKEHRPDAVNDDERKIHADDRSFDYGGIVCYLLVAITAVLCSFDAVSGNLLFFGHSVDFEDFCWLLFGISTCTYHALRSYHLHKKLDLIGAAFWFVILVLYFIKIL